jgi:hypothetical protein
MEGVPVGGRIRDNKFEFIIAGAAVVLSLHDCLHSGGAGSVDWDRITNIQEAGANRPEQVRSFIYQSDASNEPERVCDLNLVVLVILMEA